MELDTILRHGSEYYAEGNNGIILRVKRSLLATNGFDPDVICPALVGQDQVALKIIKERCRIRADEEMEKHNQAFDLVQAMPNNERAEVPKILSDITSAALQDKSLLTELCGMVPTGNQVEILFMEFLEATDFLILVYHQLLLKTLDASLKDFGKAQQMSCARSLAKIYLEVALFKGLDRIRCRDKEARRSIMAVAAHMRKAILQDGNIIAAWESIVNIETREETMKVCDLKPLLEIFRQLQGGNIEALKAYIQNLQDIKALEDSINGICQDEIDECARNIDRHGKNEVFIEFLRHKMKDTQFIPPTILSQLSNTLAHLRKQRYCHNDLHERNIMISHDLQKVFLIDFATATIETYEKDTDLGIIDRRSILPIVTKA